MDVRLVNPFIASTRRVLATLTGMEVFPGAPQACCRLQPSENRLCVIVEMRGGATGALILCFPEHVAMRLATAFVGSPISLEEIRDAMGELGNMITGGAKKELDTRLVRISPPRVVSRWRDIGSVAELSPWLIVPFNGTVGSFRLYVSLTDVEPAADRHVEERIDEAGIDALFASAGGSAADS